jgi:hypothetical protein
MHLKKTYHRAVMVKNCFEGAIFITLFIFVIGKTVDCVTLFVCHWRELSAGPNKIIHKGKT